MKKFFLVVTALALTLTLTPFRQVKAYEVGDDFEQQIAEYIPDTVFAHVIAETIRNDADFDAKSYSSPLEVLRNYSGTITYEYTEETRATIESIEGINYLENAQFNLIGQDIEDLTPLYDTSLLTGSKRAAVQINKSPVHIWPEALVNTPRDTHAIPTPLYLEGKARYLWSEDAEANLTIKYDVYTGSTANPAKIREGIASYYNVKGSGKLADPSKTDPANEDVDAKFKFDLNGEDGAVLARIQLNPFEYYSDKDEQKLTPAYYYKVIADFVFPVYFDTEASVIGGVKLVKYSAEDVVDGVPVEGAKPLAGAVYELYDANDELVGTYTTEDKPVVIKNLEPGDYYFKEITAPAGYKLDNTLLPFTIKDVDALDFTVKAGDQQIEVTSNNATFVPKWEAHLGYDMQGKDEMANNAFVNPMALVTSDTVTEKASGKLVGFIYKGIEFTDENCGFKLNGNVPEGYEEELYWTLNGGSAGSGFKAALEELVAGNIGEAAYLSLDQTITQKEEDYEVVIGVNEPITIWVENSTENDEGGTVNVKGCPTDEISSSTVYENTPREMNNVVEGQAYKEDNWYVVVDDIKVGPMGADGVSGAVYTVVEAEQDENGLYIIECEDGSIIKVKLDYDKNNEHVTVTIVDMDQNIDIAIPFARHEQKPVPVTSDLGRDVIILMATMFASGAVLNVIRKKKND